MTKKLIKHKRLLEVLTYDPETGQFFKRDKVAGHLNSKGYRRIFIDGRHYRAHRLAWFYMRRRWPRREVDHINGDRDCNKISNLRLATSSQNGHNKPPSKRNKSGFKGV